MMNMKSKNSTRTKRTIMISLSAVIIMAVAVIIVTGVSEPSLKSRTISGQGETEAGFVKQIEEGDLAQKPQYIGDELCSDGEYDYVVDEKEHFVKRISLTDKKDWDPLFEAPAGDFTKEKAVSMAEDLFRKYLSSYLSKETEIVTHVSGNNCFIIWVREEKDGIPTGVSAPLIMISHAGQVLLADFEINRHNNQNLMSIEEAKELAVQYFNDADVKTTMRLEEVTTDNVTDVEYDVIDEGTLIVSVKIAYKRSISPYILDSTSQILMDAETGELLLLLLSE